MAETPPLPEPLWKTASPEVQAAILALVAYYKQRLAQHEARVKDLENRLKLNSSKPPSSDPIGLKRKPPALPSKKKRGCRCRTDCSATGSGCVTEPWTGVDSRAEWPACDARSSRPLRKGRGARAPRRQRRASRSSRRRKDCGPSPGCKGSIRRITRPSERCGRR